MRTFGKLVYHKSTGKWTFFDLEPHVSIKLKQLFPSINKTDKFISFNHKIDTVMDIHWFTQRYPMKMKPSHRRWLHKSKKKFKKEINKLEELLSPDYKPSPMEIGSVTLRNYQVVFHQMAQMVKRMVLGDDTGIGKTFQALSLLSNEKCLPMLCVVQTHLPPQWLLVIKEIWPKAKVHYINTTKPYTLPPADIYVMKYSTIGYWYEYWPKSNISTVVFDEIQELRREGSNKYISAYRLSSEVVEYSIGLSATPIYNYGDETYSIFNLVKPGCLGNREDFNREYMDFSNRRVKDPSALGSYLREQKLFLRRTREDIGLELPEVNIIPYHIESDKKEFERIEGLIKVLATKSLQGNFQERRNSRKDLDIMMRMTTGIAKAKSVAQVAKVYLENGEKVCLVGWHREVYNIWLKELKEYNPQMYTGSETEKPKKKSFENFTSDASNLLILSLRSGAGLDGLQEHCSTLIIGELDWSPQVHHQLIGRFNRDRKDGKVNYVTCVYCISDEGSDPVMVDMLGIKGSQSKGIVDPFTSGVTKVHSDETRLKILAKNLLEKYGSK